MDGLWAQVADLLQSEHFAKYATAFDRRPLIRRVNTLSDIPMRLIHWSTLADIKRIPHSDENLAIDALEGIKRYGADVCEIFMVSHRWLRPRLDSNESHPDSIENDKAKVINEFSKWRQNWVMTTHGFRPQIFYWIDFCCINQHDLAAAVPLLPLWVACCERFLRIETADYSERTWCRLEPLLSYVFQFADHHTIINLDFKCSTSNFHHGEAIQSFILDPLEGKTTDQEDLVRIKPLVDLVKTVRMKSDRASVCFGKTTVKCFQL